MHSIVDVIAPVRCVWCGLDVGAELCTACAERVSVLTPPWCERCGTPSRAAPPTCEACRHLGWFRRARSLVAFVEAARKLTLQLKRRGRAGLARAMAELLASLARREAMDGTDVVTWVPGGASSIRNGFDHTEVLARAIAAELGVGAARLLRREVDGPRQADVPLSGRRSNVAGRFAATGGDRRVLLVDDVFTTGATAEACAQALIDGGSGGVDVLTWARTLRRVARPRERASH